MSSVGLRMFALLRTSKLHHDLRAGFKSVYSLEQLYPSSKYDFSTKLDEEVKSVAAKSDEFHGYIPTEELRIRYSRSSAPGGQNVNKSNTKVEVRFHLDTATFINDRVKRLLRENHGTRIAKDGCFSVVSEKTRTRTLNMADCLDKIRYLIRNLEQPNRVPTPDEVALQEARARKAIQDRLKEKREQSMRKEGRNADVI